MESNAGQNGLRRWVSAMVAMESQVEDTLSLLASETANYLEAPAFAERLCALVKGQREALQSHLKTVGGDDRFVLPNTLTPGFEVLPPIQRGEHGGSVIAMLRAVSQAFDCAAFGYGVLHAIAHRSYDVATADLADQHRRSYLQALQAVHGALGHAVVQELLDAGDECGCQCPSCSPGICLCWHVHGESRAEGIAPYTEGIVVRRPRTGSNAERAGLREGDVIVQVDGQDVRTYQDMLNRMRERQPGEEVRLAVRRLSGEVQELTVVR